MSLYGVCTANRGGNGRVLFSPCTVLSRFFQGKLSVCQIEEGLTLFPSFCVPVFCLFYVLFLKVTVPVSGMITIPAASLAGAQIVQTGANTNTTSSGQGTVTVTLPVAGNVVNSGGMVMVRNSLSQLFSSVIAFPCISLSLKCS